MSYNAKEFAKAKGVSKRKIKPWFDAGYLGAATRNEKTGVYDIPEDTPVPYAADSRIKRKSSLWNELLDAADLQQSIYPSMYPLLSPQLVETQIEEFDEAGLLNVRTSTSGAMYLDITPEGRTFLLSFSADERKSILDKAAKAVSVSCNLIQALQMAAPALQNLFSKLPIG